MIKTRKMLLLFAGIMVFLSAVDVSAFGDESFRRQQSQSKKGFDGFEDEFEDPEAVKPPPPKVIIREKIIIKEKLVPVPVPVEKTPEPEPVNKMPVHKRPSSDRTVSSRGFDFTLKVCTLADRNIECDFTVVSPKDDKMITLYGLAPCCPDNRWSLLFDNIGNKYFPRLVLLGNSENKRFVSRRMIVSIETPVKLYFANVSSETSSIALLELLAHDGRDYFRVKFRNVPLS